MPIAGDQPTDRHRLVRLLRVVRGSMRFRVTCKPAFDYARADHETQVTEEGAVFRSRDQAVTVHVSRPDDVRCATHPCDRSTAAPRRPPSCPPARSAAWCWKPARPGRRASCRPGEIEDLFIQTRDFWRGWIGRSRYTGRWREMVERSAMTLKLMTYAPTGALVAAPTAGLPEQVGGERNWDYRFTWIRDASFSVYAMLGLGYVEEAQAFGRWLHDRVTQARQRSEPLQIMYRVDGSPDLREETLDHLEGYQGSHPVRIGNDAAGQLQLDIYGEAMDSIHLADAHGVPITHQGWMNAEHILDWLSENWDQPDDGIWETRGGRQHFTYGRLMSWVAFDRAVRIAQRRGRPADIASWSATRDEIYRQIMDRGFHSKREAFVQHYDTDVLDASLLYMPLVGFISGNDPLWQSTLRAMDDELVSDSLVYRYDPEASPDGLRGSEGTFTICSFWYVDALARSGTPR